MSFASYCFILQQFNNAHISTYSCILQNLRHNQFATVPFVLKGNLSSQHVSNVSILILLHSNKAHTYEEESIMSHAHPLLTSKGVKKNLSCFLNPQDSSIPISNFLSKPLLDT